MIETTFLIRMKPHQSYGVGQAISVATSAVPEFTKQGKWAVMDRYTQHRAADFPELAAALGCHAETFTLAHFCDQADMMKPFAKAYAAKLMNP